MLFYFQLKNRKQETKPKAVICDLLNILYCFPLKGIVLFLCFNVDLVCINENLD